MKFIDSLKETKTRSFWLIFSLEIALLLLTSLGFMAWNAYLDNELSAVPFLDLNTQESLLDNQTLMMDSFITKLYVTSFILFIFLIFNYTFWKAFIWSKLNKTKLKHYWKFTGITILCLIVEIIILYALLMLTYNLALSTIANQNLAVGTTFVVLNLFVILPLMLYIINAAELVQYYFYNSKDYFKKALYTLKQIKKLYWPHVAMGLVLLVISIILSFFEIYQIFSIVLTGILLALYFTWTKFYLLKLK